MITPKKYLNAKRIVQKYEKELNISAIKQYNIGVISLNSEDFKQWRLDSKLQYDKYAKHTRKQFNVANTTYYCISNICDLCSLLINEIIETKYAKENKEYEKIKLIAKCNLKITEHK